MNRFTKTPDRKSQNRQGATTVEFALIAPLLFTLIFTMCEASRFLMGLHATTGAAREAARTFAVRGDEAAARTAAIDFLRSSSFNIEDVNVTFSRTDSIVPSVQNISCVVQVDYSDVSLIGGRFSLGKGAVRGYGAMTAIDDS